MRSVKYKRKFLTCGLGVNPLLSTVLAGHEGKKKSMNKTKSKDLQRTRWVKVS